MWVWAIAAALAADPTITVADDGSIVARLDIAAPEASVRAAIPELQRAGVNSNVLAVTARPEGACTAFDRTTRGLWRPLQLRTRFCPSSTGYSERLVASEDFTRYEADWTLRPISSNATSVQLRVRSDVNLMVPTSLLQTGTMDGVRETFQALLRRLGR
jgi:hypothetical protein